MEKGSVLDALYDGDSFFTLSTTGQVGLAVLSLVLTGLVLAALWVFPRRGVVIFAVILFWLFVWVSPQIYYSYYQQIIPGLPTQIVVGDPPGSDFVIGLITFSGEANLSDHGKGVLFWLMMAVALIRRVGPRPVAN